MNRLIQDTYFLKSYNLIYLVIGLSVLCMTISWGIELLVKQLFIID